MMQGEVVAIDTNIALHAARLSDSLKIPMAGSMILATAREHEATLWTQDADFESLSDVQYISRKT